MINGNQIQHMHKTKVWFFTNTSHFEVGRNRVWRLNIINEWKWVYLEILWHKINRIGVHYTFVTNEWVFTAAYQHMSNQHDFYLSAFAMIGLKSFYFQPLYRWRKLNFINLIRFPIRKLFTATRRTSVYPFSSNISSHRFVWSAPSRLFIIDTVIKFNTRTRNDI